MQSDLLHGCQCMCITYVNAMILLQSGLKLWIQGDLNEFSRSSIQASRNHQRFTGLRVPEASRISFKITVNQKH